MPSARSPSSGRSGRVRPGNGSRGASPMRRSVIGELPATAACCAVSSHCAGVRTIGMTIPAAAPASSSSAASHRRIAAATASGSSGTPRNRWVAARSPG